MPYLHQCMRYNVKNNKLSPSSYSWYITLVMTYTNYYSNWDAIIYWQKIIVSRMCILYCAMPWGVIRWFVLHSWYFCFSRAKNTLYPLRCVLNKTALNTVYCSLGISLISITFWHISLILMAYHIVSSMHYTINKAWRSSEVKVKVIRSYKIKTSHILNLKKSQFLTKTVLFNNFIAISLFIFDCCAQVMIKGLFYSPKPIFYSFQLIENYI